MASRNIIEEWKLYDNTWAATSISSGHWMTSSGNYKGKISDRNMWKSLKSPKMKQHKAQKTEMAANKSAFKEKRCSWVSEKLCPQKWLKDKTRSKNFTRLKFLRFGCCLHFNWFVRRPSNIHGYVSARKCRVTASILRGTLRAYIIVSITSPAIDGELRNQPEKDHKYY